MRKTLRLGAVAVALLATAAIAAPVARDVTVGRFIQELAKAKHLIATDARIATDSLRAVGIRLPADLDPSRTLTEGDVVRISQAAGLNVSTSNPDAVFGADKVERFFLSFSEEFSASAASPSGEFPRDCEGRFGNQGNGRGCGPPFDPFSKGKGKGKGKGGPTPYEPE